MRRSKRNRIAREYLDRVGLADWAEHRPSELSGGQQQRVAIARALIAEPKVILADEPTGALDSQTSLEIMEILRGINRQGTTVVIVTHEHDISELTDRIIHLRDGVDRRAPRLTDMSRLPKRALTARCARRLRVRARRRQAPVEHAGAPWRHRAAP